jgi:hypothetical protein
MHELVITCEGFHPSHSPLGGNCIAPRPLRIEDDPFTLKMSASARPEVLDRFQIKINPYIDEI